MTLTHQNMLQNRSFPAEHGQDDAYWIGFNNGYRRGMPQNRSCCPVKPDRPRADAFGMARFGGQFCDRYQICQCDHRTVP